jgi:hypothetical protein
MSDIIWHSSTRNHHVGELDGFVVVEVVRPQKHRSDGTPHDWRINVLGNNLYNQRFVQFDPQNLDSAKSAAEARTRWAIDHLHKASHARAEQEKK